jgi:hypothetical protein
VKAVQPKPELIVRWRRAQATDLDWQETLAGDPVDVESALLEGVARRLSSETRRTLTDAEWASGSSAADDPRRRDAGLRRGPRAARP